MLMLLAQQEKPFPRDPLTHIILGAEPFEYGEGDHAVLFIHGWTSTPRDLRFLGERIAEKGYYSRGILLPGHGRTFRALKGLRFTDYLGHCTEAIGEMVLKYESVSIVGLSMGGLLGLHLAAHFPIKNLVLLAPFLRPAGSTMGISNRRMAGLAKLWTDEIPKEGEGPIFDAVAAAQHITYHAMPAEGLADVVQAGQDIVPMLGRIHCPTLIFHSAKDRTSDFEGSCELMKRLGSEDRTLIALNRSNHVISLDYDRSRIEEETLHWLSRHP